MKITMSILIGLFLVGGCANKLREPATEAEVAPPIAVEQLNCLVFGTGITVLDNQEALAKLGWATDQRCASLTRQPVDFAGGAIVLFEANATCTGAIEVIPAGFIWAETGTCEKALRLRASKRIPLAQAGTQVATKVDPAKIKELRESILN